MGGIPVSETIVSSFVATVVLISLVVVFTWRLKKIPKGKQVLAEKFVMMIYGFVEENAGSGGKHFDSFTAYIGALFLFSILNSLSVLVGLRPATADLSTTLGWAAVTFVLVIVTKIRTKKLGGYLKELSHPIFFMLPMNIVGEATVPLAMALRHFCNILVGCIFGELIGVFLGSLSGMFFGTFGSRVPIFKLGLPAVLSLYFDLFASFIQAFVFVTLTMTFVGRARKSD